MKTATIGQSMKDWSKYKKINFQKDDDADFNPITMQPFRGRGLSRGPKKLEA